MCNIFHVYAIKYAHNAIIKLRASADCIDIFYMNVAAVFKIHNKLTLFHLDFKRFCSFSLRRNHVKSAVFNCPFPRNINCIFSAGDITAVRLSIPLICGKPHGFRCLAKIKLTFFGRCDFRRCGIPAPA